MPRVNPSLMVWARETAGLTREAAAVALKLSPDRLAELEGGMEPSNKQLLDMVKAYRRSLLTFYLAEPPKRAERGEDFRTFREARPPEMESRLDALMRDVQTRQLLIRNILMEDDDAGPLRFVSSLNRGSEVGAVLSAVREAIGISTKDMRQQKDPGAASSATRMQSRSERPTIGRSLMPATS